MLKKHAEYSEALTKLLQKPQEEATPVKSPPPNIYPPIPSNVPQIETRKYPEYQEHNVLPRFIPPTTMPNFPMTRMPETYPTTSTYQLPGYQSRLERPMTANRVPPPQFPFSAQGPQTVPQFTTPHLENQFPFGPQPIARYQVKRKNIKNRPHQLLNPQTLEKEQ